MILSNLENYPHLNERNIIQYVNLEKTKKKVEKESEQFTLTNHSCSYCIILSNVKLDQYLTKDLSSTIFIKNSGQILTLKVEDNVIDPDQMPFKLVETLLSSFKFRNILDFYSCMQTREER